jgi:hypothetical protein
VPEGDDDLVVPSRRARFGSATCVTFTKMRSSPAPHLPPRQLFVRRTPHTPKSSASEKLRNVGDSTWMTPLASCVWIGEMN